MKPRDCWLYELRHGHEIVYYGISKTPDRREIQQRDAGKRFTHMNVISVALCRSSAERREGDETKRYQKQHSGTPPKYNVRKTYKRGE